MVEGSAKVNINSDNFISLTEASFRVNRATVLPGGSWIIKNGRFLDLQSKS